MSINTNCYFDEEFQENPIAKQAYEYLNENGLIYAGSVISKEHVENALNMKYIEDDWRFRGPCLIVHSMIKNLCFFVTEAKIDAPGFRILSTEEMAHHNETRLYSRMMQTSRDAFIMAGHDISCLTEEDKKRHLASQYKTATTAIMQHKIFFQSKVL